MLPFLNIDQASRSLPLVLYAIPSCTFGSGRKSGFPGFGAMLAARTRVRGSNRNFRPSKEPGNSQGSGRAVASALACGAGDCAGGDRSRAGGLYGKAQRGRPDQGSGA